MKIPVRDDSIAYEVVEWVTWKTPLLKLIATWEEL